MNNSKYNKLFSCPHCGKMLEWDYEVESIDFIGYYYCPDVDCDYAISKYADKSKYEALRKIDKMKHKN